MPPIRTWVTSQFFSGPLLRGLNRPGKNHLSLVKTSNGNKSAGKIPRALIGAIGQLLCRGKTKRQRSFQGRTKIPLWMYLAPVEDGVLVGLFLWDMAT